MSIPVYVFNEETKSYSADVQTDPRSRIQYELGDSKQPNAFYPQFKTMHWDNECNFSVRLVDDDPSTATIDQSANGTVIWSRGDRVVNLYSKESPDENGAFEFETILTTPPISNVLTFTIQTKGLKFCYQPELTDKQIADGYKRPENVIGSYAVYHESQKHDREGGKSYRTGKAFHIYRPWAEDANGTRVWCELSIDTEVRITIPQDFLDTAIYPVMVDPTFGYTTPGASSVNITNVARASKAVLGTAVTTSKMSSYLIVGGANTDTGNAIYAYVSDTDGGALVAASSTTAAVVGTGWSDFTLVQALSASNFFLAALASSAAGTCELFFDSGGAGLANGGQSYPTWPDPFVEDGTDGNLYSIYVTYNESAVNKVGSMLTMFQ